jgi:succinate-semialdehyde dehydrogenase/glutarate-semialdehyde dehydrogenase
MVVLAAAAGGCSHAALPASPAPGTTPPPLTPTVTPTAVPVLGTLTLGVFPATQGGADALQVCEDWAGLRGQYIARVLAGDTPAQMELWFSSAAWQPAFSANGPLKVNPAYGNISVALGMATIGQTAGVTEAKRLDAACTAADLAALTRRCLGPGTVAPVTLSHQELTAVTPGAGMTNTPSYQVTDPATGEVAETFPFATDAEVERTLAAASAAFAEWKKRPVAERAAVVKRVAGLFTERAADLAALITKEMGKRPAQAVDEAEFCTAIFGYYADNGPELLRDRPLPGHGTARVEYLPVGPVLGVMPWNYPYYQVARFAAPNLMVGNTVILKHAENCPTSALAIEQIMKDAGVPDGVYVNIFATHEQVAAMIADPRLRGVSLTGSERAGTVVAAQAGRNLKKVVLELGGSDPYIILDTPDVEEAAETAWTTRMENVGQACNSNKRMIVMDDVYDDFVAALVKRAAAMKPREPGDDSDQAYSPMVSRKAAENLLAQVRDAVSKGATLHVGGQLASDKGAYFAPAVLTGVTPEMRAYREELFGPVAVVYKVTSDADAVSLANAVDFGLGGAVWSADTKRAANVAAQLEVGMANVNTPAMRGSSMMCSTCSCVAKTLT